MAMVHNEKGIVTNQRDDQRDESIIYSDQN